MSTNSPPIEFNTGFEFEFASPLDQAHVADMLRAKNHNAIRVDRLQRVWDGTHRVFVTRDGSVTAPDGYNQIEVVTSPRKLNESIYEMGQLLSFIQEIGGITNASTGLHIGVSFIDAKKQRDFNPIKMLYHFPESDLLDMWHRKGNRYCRELKGQVLNNLITSHLMQLTVPKLLTPDVIKSLIIGQREGGAKYFTINFLKLSHGYLEFRFMGGQNYHQNTTQILKSITVIHNAMSASLDPNRDKEGYQAWLKSMHIDGWKHLLKMQEKRIEEYRSTTSAIEKQITQLRQLIAT